MIMLFTSTVAAHSLSPPSARRIGFSIARSSPNWKMPSASKVIFGGRVVDEIAAENADDQTLLRAAYGLTESERAEARA